MVCAPGANTKCLTNTDPNTLHEAFSSKNSHVNSLSSVSLAPRLFRTCNCTLQCSLFSWKERFQLNTHHVPHHVASKKWLVKYVVSYGVSFSRFSGFVQVLDSTILTLAVPVGRFGSIGWWVSLITQHCNQFVEAVQECGWSRRRWQPKSIFIRFLDLFAFLGLLVFFL